jgi:hypothetical protein
MSQSRKSRFVFMSIRIVCGLVFLVLVFRDFQLHGWLRVFGDIGFGVIAFGVAYASRQGRKLAADNMRRAGLSPDRDEALPACKAIDN